MSFSLNVISSGERIFISMLCFPFALIFLINGRHDDLQVNYTLLGLRASIAFSFYNTQMRYQRTLNWLVLIVYGIGALYLPQPVRADQSHPVLANAVSAFDLLIAMNTLRVSHGLPALIEDPIVDALAQSTAT